MPPGQQSEDRWTRRRRRVLPAAFSVTAALLLGVLVFLWSADSPPSVLEQAIRARGGPLPGLITSLVGQVHRGFPGEWRYERVFVQPELYGWKIVTSGPPHYHLYDGEAVRSFVGSAAVGTDTSRRAPLRSQARWFAVIYLDALRAPGMTLAPLPAEALPPGASSGLVAVWADGATYRLGFDDELLLRWAQGPVDLPQLGSAELTAHYEDYRRVEGLRLPFAVSYTIDDEPLVDESVLEACLAPAAITAEAFGAPELLPSCR